MSRFAVLEGIQPQGEDDARAWIVDTSKQTASPTSPSVPRIIDVGTNKNVKTKVMPTDSPTVSGSEITLSLLQSLTPGHKYQVYVKWVDGSETKSTFFFVECPDRE